MYKVGELSLDFIKTHWPKSRVNQMERLLLCGGEGDPIYNSSFLEIVNYFKTTKPELEIVIVTNGSYRQESWWQELKGILNAYDSLVFSIDGWDQDSNQQYRVNCDWDSIVRAVQIMSKSRALVHWSTILFRFNQGNIEKIRRLAKELGADRHTLVKSSLFGYRIHRYIDSTLGYDPLEPDKSYLNSLDYHSKSFVVLSDKQGKRSQFHRMHRQWLSDIKERARDWYVLPLCRVGDRALYVNA